MKSLIIPVGIINMMEKVEFEYFNSFLFQYHYARSLLCKM